MKQPSGKEYYILAIENDPERMDKLVNKAANRVAEDMLALSVIPLPENVAQDELETSIWWTGCRPEVDYYEVNPAEAEVIVDNFASVYYLAERIWQGTSGHTMPFWYVVMPENQLLEEIGYLVETEPPEGVTWALQLDANQDYYGYQLIVESNPLEIPWDTIDTYKAEFLYKAREQGINIK